MSKIWDVTKYLIQQAGLVISDNDDDKAPQNYRPLRVQVKRVRVKRVPVKTVR